MFKNKKKEWSTDAYDNIVNLENIMLSERSQTQKATITFIWNAQNKQIHRDRVD
jgi:hypothetical protein